MSNNPITRAWPLLPIAILFILPALDEALHTEHAVAVEGTIYQVIGIGVVVFSLDEKLKHFRGISLLGSLWGWFKDLWNWLKSLWPWRKPKHVNLHGSAVGGSYGFGRGSIIQQINHLPTQEQLDWIKKKVDELSQKIDANDDKVQQQLRNIESKIGGIESSITAKISEFNTKLGRFMTGSFKWEFVGTVFLAVGVIFGTVPWWMCKVYGG